MPRKPSVTKRPPPVRERERITVYVEPEILERLDYMCNAERRSRGNMTHEILRRYIAFVAEKATA